MHSSLKKIQSFYNAGKLCVLLVFFHVNAFSHPEMLGQSIGVKDSLIIFTGSDWCLPCMRLEKIVLTDSLFINYTKYSIAFIQADFPQLKKLSAEEVTRNEVLAERFNKDGVFPIHHRCKKRIPDTNSI